MAFSATLTEGPKSMGPFRVCLGSFSQDNGDTGGAIATPLHTVLFAEATAALNIAVSGGTATITTADPGAAQAGYWMAIGY
jgi:hypothetical protein